MPLELVKAAMVEELNYFNEKVWEIEEAKNLVGDEGSNTVRTRWVVCNKGDSTNYDVRARLVACEVATTGAMIISPVPIPWRRDDCPCPRWQRGVLMVEVVPLHCPS